MLLNRIGSKDRLLTKLLPYFPKHDIYIEMFFGSGSVFFNKPKANYSFLNDFDNEVYNVFDVLIRKKDELAAYLLKIPYHTAFWDECKNRKSDNDIERAVYFLCLSNFGYMGRGDTLRFGINNTKSILIENLEKAYLQIVNSNTLFMSTDFRDMFDKISFKHKDKERSFIYADPPYFETENNYNVPKWKEKDTIDCFDVVFNQGINAALSEFDHPLILDLAKQKGLNIDILDERCNMKNRRIEVLITNYQKQQLTIFN